MGCSKKKLISLYIDDELSAGEGDLLESHINECRECTGELMKLQKIHELFAGAATFEAPYGFSTRVLVNVRSRKTERFTGSFHVLAKAAEGFAVLVLILAGIILGRFLSSSFVFEKGNEVASLSLNVFTPAPPDSVGGVYLAMTEAENEK
jgi:anti-sigma factor RsiW